MHFSHSYRSSIADERVTVCGSIGLYRDVWIAAIASSRTSLATLSGVMCNTSQCDLRSLRVNSGMLNVIRIVTYYALPPVRVARLFLDCNGVFAIKAYRPLLQRLDRCNRVIQSEAKYPFCGNVYYVTMQITFFTLKFRNGQHNLNALPPNGSFASLSIAMEFSR